MGFTQPPIYPLTPLINGKLYSYDNLFVPILLFSIDY